MDVSTSGSQHRGRASVSHEALAVEEPAVVAAKATFVVTTGVAGGAMKVMPQAASAEPAIMRAVRGTLDRDCGIAAVSRTSGDGHQSRQARRDHPPGAVAKRGHSGTRAPSPSPIAAWIALRGGFTG